MLGGIYPSVLWYVGLSHFVSRGCGPTVRGDGFCPLSLYGRPDVHHYYKIHGRCSDTLLSPAVLSVKRAVRIEYATLTEDPYPGRKLPFTGKMMVQAIIYHRARQSMGDQLISLTFRCGFSHLLRAAEYLNPSGSRLSSLYTGEARGVPVSNDRGGDGVSEWRGATSVTDSLLHDTCA